MRWRFCSNKLVFDGNAQDFYIGLDDSADDLIIGVGSTVGTTPAIVIDENQNVGIGVTPGQNFNLEDTGAVEVRFRSTDNDCYLQISSDTDEGQDSVLQFLSGTSGRGSIIYDHNPTAASQKMIFKTGDNAVSAMTIDGSGNVGIGTTTPDFLLDVEGSNTQFKVGTASQDGGFLTSTDNNQLIVSGGFYYNGRNFIATAGSASGVSFDNVELFSTTIRS